MEEKEKPEKTQSSVPWIVQIICIPFFFVWALITSYLYPDDERKKYH